MPANPTASFSASYDPTTKVVSAVVSILLFAIVAITQSVLIGCLAGILLAGAYAYSPGGYAISERSLLVKRLSGDVRIPLDGIRSVRVATPDDFRGAVRLFGNGGLFGYYGLFRTTQLGKCWWYVTNPKNGVVVVTSDKTVLMSPDDVDRFLAAMRAASVPVSTVSTTSTPESASPFRGGSTVGKVIGGTILLLVGVVVVFALTYSPGPPRYTLTPNSITIHDRFFPATVNVADIDIDRIRLVNIGTDPEWRPVARTNGFANGHYQTGWFRVANNQKIRMFKAQSKILVLLPAKGNGAAVLLEVQEPEKFMDEVCRWWFRRCE